ncbi:MAG: D-sedoheptulose-7-phosphate isomerase, partial [Polyangiaceae bacterium]
ALVTAVGNDDDFALVFSKQLRLLGKPGDVAVGFSTSGTSASVVRALRAAKAQGLLTVGIAGRDGGKMIEACDHCLTVASYSIHRIQETHVALLHVLWDLVHVVRGEEDVL